MLSDTLFESFQNLLQEYKETYFYKDYEVDYTHKVVFENLLFNMLRTLYIIDCPKNDTICISRLPSADWIRNHIQELLQIKNY